MDQIKAPLLEEITPKSNLHRVTPFSKYLALLLFVTLPFLGGYIGYIHAPEKVIEVERIVYLTQDQNELSIGLVDDEEVAQPFGFTNLPSTLGVLSSIEFSYTPSQGNNLESVLHAVIEEPDNDQEFTLNLVDKDDAVVCNITQWDRNLQEHNTFAWLPDFSPNGKCPDAKVSTEYRIQVVSADKIGYSDYFSIVPSSFAATLNNLQLLTFEELDRGYQFSYPNDWRLNVGAASDYGRQGYIQLFNFPEKNFDSKGWGDNENKIERGVILDKSAFNDWDEFTETYINDLLIYTRKGGIDDGHWNWTSFAVPNPKNNEEVAYFVVYGDTDNIDSVLEVFLENFSFVDISG